MSTSTKNTPNKNESAGRERIHHDLEKRGEVITMNVAQVRQLLDLSGCDASSDETETEVSLCRGDGHSGPGLYFWMTDYADEGALLLDGEVQCDLPPFGWRCTRQAGHEGPCAAVEAPEDQALVERGMERLIEAASQSPVAPADHEDAAELIVRDVCELDPANPDLNDTVCVDVSDLLIIAKRHIVDRARLADARPMVDMVPPATSRDRWMYEQGRLAERDPRTPKDAPTASSAEFALRALVAAGHVSADKVRQARAIFASLPDAPTVSATVPDGEVLQIFADVTRNDEDGATYIDVSRDEAIQIGRRIQSALRSASLNAAPTPSTSAADAERLDALEAFAGKNQWIVAKGIDSFTVHLKPRNHATRQTLREAIDAAIAASKEGSDGLSDPAA